MRHFYWLALIGAVVAIVFAETFPFYVQACGPCMLLADLSGLLQPFVLALFAVRVMVVLTEWWPDKERLNLGRDAADAVFGCSIGDRTTRIRRDS